MSRIISASRRSDIPRYFGAWFAGRRREGFARFRNAFGVAGEVSLRNEDVSAYLFWTRFARPFREPLAALRREEVPYAFQYTITGYGRPLERYNPPLAAVVSDFLSLSRELPDPECIQWRYDPIVVSQEQDTAFHRTNFASIARRLEGATRVVNCSVVEPYVKTVRRVADETVRYRPLDPKRHKSVARKHPNLPSAGEPEQELLDGLASIAADHGMELKACCNPEWGLPASACAGADLFAPYGLAFGNLPNAPTRPTCRCFHTVDIGMDNTCLAGCRYCYVVTSHKVAVANRVLHDPGGECLRRSAP